MLVEPPLQLDVRPLAGAEPGIMLGKYGAFSWFVLSNHAETRPAATWVGQFFGMALRVASRRVVRQFSSGPSALTQIL